MNSLLSSALILACVFGGALAGMMLRARLPKHHLGDDTKDVIKLGTGLIGTMAALVLGLLIGSTRASYDTQKGEVTELTANMLLLDRILAQYGPEANSAREQLRQTASLAAERIWANAAAGPAQPAPISSKGEDLYRELHQLRPADEAQRELRTDAVSICKALARTRLLLFQQTGDSSISMPIVIILVFWLSIIFTSFGLFAPRNATVVATLLVCALSVAAAMFLILELDHPFTGLVQISSVPLRSALPHLGH